MTVKQIETINPADAKTRPRPLSDTEKFMYHLLVAEAVRAAMNLSNFATLIGKGKVAELVDESVAEPLAGLLADIYTEKKAADVDASRQN